MAGSNDGSWITAGTAAGLDDVFAPAERASKLLSAQQKNLDDIFKSAAEQDLLPYKTDYQKAFYENQTDAQNSALDARGEAADLAELLAPLTRQTAEDNAAAAALKAANARGALELTRYEDARYADGTTGATRREILAAAAVDPALGVGAQAEARRVLRSVDVYEVTALASADPGSALNEAVGRGIIPVKVQATAMPDGSYSVQNATGPVQRLDRRAMSAMFNDMMIGATKNTDTLLDKRASVEDLDSRAAARIASQEKMNADRIASAERRAAAARAAADMRRDNNDKSRLIKLDNGEVWSMSEVRTLLEQPEVQAYLKDPSAPTPLGSKTIAALNGIASVISKRSPRTAAANTPFDPSVGVNGQRLINPITGAPQ